MLENNILAKTMLSETTLLEPTFVETKLAETTFVETTLAETMLNSRNHVSWNPNVTREVIRCENFVVAIPV